MSRITFLRYAQLPIKRLRSDVPWATIADDPVVDELRDSTGRIGMINAPVVRVPHHMVIAGRKRVAAAIKAGETVIMCKVVECDDATAKELEVAENAVRKHSAKERTALIQEMYALRAPQVMASLEAQEPEEVLEFSEKDPFSPPKVTVKKPRGRPKSAVAQTVSMVAAELGVSAPTVRKAIFEPVKQGQIRDMGLAEGKVYGDPGIDMLGAPADLAWSERTKTLALALQRSGMYARKLLKELEAALECTNVTPEAASDLAGFAASVLNVEKGIERVRPVMACPWCKAIPGIIDTCAVCESLGYAAERARTTAPAELLQDANPCVMRAGRLTSVKDL